MGLTRGREMHVVQRLNLFWLAVTAALLVIGCVTAGDGQPALWQSWRGPAMVLTSLAFLGWYLLLSPIRIRTGWPAPPHVAYPYLATGFVLTAVLFSFSQSFSGALYVLIGLSVSVRPLKETVLPVGVADLRSSLAGLRLPALDEQRFGTALDELAGDLRDRGAIDVEVAITDEADALDRAVQEALYRVAQEGLANVAKHARARRVTLTLALCAETTWLEVCDDGVGLGASPRLEGGHYGVVGMRERVEALGGVFTLGPRPGGGALLRAAIPLVASEERAGVRHPHPVG